MTERPDGTRVPVALVGDGVAVPCITGETRPYINLDAAASTAALPTVAARVNDFLPWYSSVDRGAGYKSRLSTNEYEAALEAAALAFAGRATDRAEVAIFCRNTTEAINHLVYRLRLCPDDLAAAAYRIDDRTGEAASLALRAALFEHGDDISAPQVLARIAEAHGIAGAGPDDDRQVLTDWDDGRSRGVKGSSHFFCGDLESFCPALSMARDESGHLRVHRDAEALDAYLAKCFAR